MRAVRYHGYGGPEVLRLEELPTPQPGPGEIRVAMQAAGTIPLDWKLRAGLLREHFTPGFPKIPGREGSGVVDAVGPGVEGVAPGDAVCVTLGPTASGTGAEAVLCRPGDVVRKPAGLGFTEAAALLHSGVCALISLVEVAAVGPGTRLLVQAGAGAIGGAAIQLARHLGAEVTATCRAVNADYAAALGAHRVVPYDREDFSETCRDFDVVLDLIGGEVHRRSYPVLRRGGCLVYLIAEPIEDRSAEYGVRLVRAPIQDTPERLRQVVELAEAGVFRPQIAAVLPLAEIAEAHRRLAAGRVTRGRIVLQIA
ncbi:NADP-dependent oxidoreductase [Roseomonas sp. BN140053]|uniref:NADP-dependent oxidoreductase n=1 Tax=Roseomonas sp. BN140053 TaxID=3391898 RepID=UPI0039ED7995